LLHLRDHRRFDAIILDRLLPGIDGIEVLRRVRQDHGDPPVLILSALNDTWHRIQSIQAGADDYLKL
jgi:two-component system OmpR family response regulator